MRHLILSREYPPAPYAQGGIGTYVSTIARRLAERGEVVHVIGQRWRGAPAAREEHCGGRLIVHRIGIDDPPTNAGHGWQEERAALRRSPCSAEWFSWSAAFLAEHLIRTEGIDTIEAQEWEAPLYHFLLRRALGLGPAHHPPCIIHLHTPTAIIAPANGDNPASPAVSTLVQMEEHCIAAADALLCPSRYLARQTEERFALAPGTIRVIPLPLPVAPHVDRPDAVWAGGSLCFIGRLEARKGVLEWVDAAVQAAAEHDGLRFEFVGSDTLTGRRGPTSRISMRRTLIERIPKPLRTKFMFHDPRPQAQLRSILAQAMAAVVPSRWENFPYACLEAMASGLPVIASRHGGMAEVIEDGQTGWLTPDCGLPLADGLADALRRCLETEPSTRSAMGRLAAETVRQHCNDERILAAHLAFRTEVLNRGTMRSAALPAWPSRLGRRAEPGTGGADIGIVVRVTDAERAAPLLASLSGQSRRPAVLALAGPPSVLGRIGAHKDVIACPAPGSAARCWNIGLMAARQLAQPAGWMFLDESVRLRGDALERLGDALAACPQAGLLSPWTASARGRADLRPGPRLPYQWLGNGAATASVVRDTAIGLSAPFPDDVVPGGELWELTVALLVAGWATATYPALLAERIDLASADWLDEQTIGAIRARLLRRFPEAAATDAATVVELATLLPRPAATSVAETGMRYLRTAVHDPRRALAVSLQKLGKIVEHVHWRSVDTSSQGKMP